jgi:hypothetical protein
MTSPVAPAMKAVTKLRAEINKRAGKEGGNLNEKCQAWLDTIDTTLRQIEPLGNMLKVLNQQTEVTVHTFRALNRQPLLLEENGDADDETKGQ